MRLKPTAPVASSVTAIVAKCAPMGGMASCAIISASTQRARPQVVIAKRAMLIMALMTRRERAPEVWLSGWLSSMPRLAATAPA